VVVTTRERKNYVIMSQRTRATSSGLLSDWRLHWFQVAQVVTNFGEVEREFWCCAPKSSALASKLNMFHY
jgi:hypothetical protein